jgi:hypothetical protein
MTNKILILAIVLVAGLSASFTTAAKKQATVFRDCTGTYLRMDKTDYLVCNKEILQDVPDGSAVTVKFRKVKKCPPTDEVVCMMYHEHKGTVKISKVSWAKGSIEHK